MTDNEIRATQMLKAAQEMQAVAHHLIVGSYEVYQNYLDAMALDLWNADHNYLDGMTMGMWKQNLAEGGVHAAAQYRYLNLAKCAVGEEVTSKDGRELQGR